MSIRLSVQYEYSGCSARLSGGQRRKGKQNTGVKHKGEPRGELTLLLSVTNQESTRCANVYFYAPRFYVRFVPFLVVQ